MEPVFEDNQSVEEPSQGESMTVEEEIAPLPERPGVEEETAPLYLIDQELRQKKKNQSIQFYLDLDSNTIRRHNLHLEV